MKSRLQFCSFFQPVISVVMFLLLVKVLTVLLKMNKCTL